MAGTRATPPVAFSTCTLGFDLPHIFCSLKDRTLYTMVAYVSFAGDHERAGLPIPLPNSIVHQDGENVRWPLEAEPIHLSSGEEWNVT